MTKREGGSQEEKNPSVFTIERKGMRQDKCVFVNYVCERDVREREGKERERHASR